MMKPALIAALLLACGNWACQARIGQPGEAKTVQGCLATTAGGAYTLTDDSGHVYQLTGDQAQLRRNVGQEVLIRGNQAQSGRMPGAPAEATSQGVQSRIVVTSMRPVSSKCSSVR